MRIYATKLTLVEALRWDGRTATFHALRRAFGDAVALRGHATLLVHTPEGPRTADAGDWIVKDVSGTAFPMNDSIFNRKFEPFDVAGVEDHGPELHDA